MRFRLPVPDRRGSRWAPTEFFVDKIGRIDTAGNIEEFPGATGPDRITTGPDGNLWFTAPFNNTIGRLDIETDEITEFQLPTPSQPRDIVAGPDGNLWFTEFNAGQLSRITPGGVITRVQKVRDGVWGIGQGPGNDIWVTQMDGNRIARFVVSP